MKDIGDLFFPEDVRYANDHEWARTEGDLVKVGISDFAQDQLGDITFVELPAIGDSFDQGGQFGTLESTKAVSELYLPIGGEVMAVNDGLADEPGLVNKEPYGGGWLVTIKPQDPAQMATLMDREAYLVMLKDQA